MFDKNLNQMFKSHFRKTENIIVSIFIFSCLMSLVMLGFIGWVIVMVMRYFGIV